MAYCTESDVRPLLGDLELASNLNIATFIDRAAIEVELALGQRYVVPIVAGDYFTNKLLQTVNAELAASQIFLSQASGGEDNRVNAYGMLLFNRANERLKEYLIDKYLPGTEIRDTSAISVGPTVIYHEDSASPLTAFYRWAQGADVPW